MARGAPAQLDRLTQEAGTLVRRPDLPDPRCTLDSLLQPGDPRDSAVSAVRGRSSILSHVHQRLRCTWERISLRTRELTIRRNATKSRHPARSASPSSVHLPPRLSRARGPTGRPYGALLHVEARSVEARKVGSSPLARGAPRRPPGPGAPPRDHPRSRGVHSRAWPALTWSVRSEPGSSPLARGALHVGAQRHGVAGIIPARAGCTQATPLSRARQADHPRSRGVHTSEPTEEVPGAGSSPLARGAPGPLLRGADDVGIIPARAGCTGAGPHQPVRAPDHPRSRGVHGTVRP